MGVLKREDGRGDGLLYPGGWHPSAHVGMLKLESALEFGQAVSHIRVPTVRDSLFRLPLSASPIDCDG